jgi:hypothetical protein
MSGGGAAAAITPAAHATGEAEPGLARWEVAGYAVAAIFALVPFVRMALLVRDAASLQYNDYWLLVDHFTNPDGSLNAAGLFDFEFQNHPVVLPLLVYWANIPLFDGSNVALGRFVLVLALGILAMIGLILARSRFRPVDQMAILVLASCLLFTPNGAWNYVMAMSGTAWLGAALVGLIAVHLRSQDRYVLAFAVAALGAITYATGLVIWPALIAVGACRRVPRQWWREWPFAVAFVVTYLWYKEVQTSGLGKSVPFRGFVDTARLVAELLAFPLGLEGSAAELVGFVVLLGISGLSIWFAVVARSERAAPWVGVAVFGLLGTVSLVLGRYVLVAAGGQNRYSSVPAVALIGFAGLVVLAIRQRDERAGADQRRHGSPARWSAIGWDAFVAFGVFGVAALLSSTSGGEHVEWTRGLVPGQELREVALHLDLVDGTPYLSGLAITVTDLLVDIGHYPFVDGWDLDCGLLDQPIDANAHDSGPPIGEIVSSRQLTTLRGAVEVTGRISSDRPIRCIVLADGDGLVIGAAALGVDDVTGVGDGSTGFIALGRPGADVYRAYVVFDDNSTPVLVDEISRADIP